LKILPVWLQRLEKLRASPKIFNKKLPCIRVSDKKTLEWWYHKSSWGSRYKKYFSFIKSTTLSVVVASSQKLQSEIINGKYDTLIFPNRNRLGRASYKGEMLLLRSCGISVKFESKEKGKFANRAAVKKSLCFGKKFAGLFVVPSWLGIGVELGKVALVKFPLTERRVIIPNNSIRCEHFLLCWGLTGVKNYPYLLNTPVAATRGRCYAVQRRCYAVQRRCYAVKR
jgi:hypothetical protein